MEFYLSIDLGTSSVKLMLVDSEGNIANTASREYSVSYPHAGWSEQNADDWWNAICDALPELLAGRDGMSVKGIGVAGQMHGLVAIDASNRPIRPVILWNDGRTAKETAYLNEVVGKEKLFEYTGNIAFAGFTAPKLLWMRENEPENFAKIHKVLLPKDYINLLLTGAYATDLSDASGMLLLDVKNRAWSGEMLDICGITEAQMPALYESYEVIGKVKPEIAGTFGLNPDAIVVAGAGDNAAAAVGTDTVGAGGCNISLGTSGTVFVSSDTFSGDVTQAIHAFCHADGGYHLMGCILSAASCNKWFCDEVLCTKDYRAEEDAVTQDKLGRNAVYFLPYLMGERSPINDTNAAGTFVGLRPDSTRADMYQAVLEGVAFAIKDNVEIIRAFGIDVRQSCLCGGGAKSALWRRILANVLDAELVLPVTEQGPGYGAAMLAMVGAGTYDSVKTCADAFFKAKATVKPEPELVALYKERYQKFSHIYPAMKKLFLEIKE